jgi:hypothetical protein
MCISVQLLDENQGYWSGVDFRENYPNIFVYRRCKLTIYTNIQQRSTPSALANAQLNKLTITFKEYTEENTERKQSTGCSAIILHIRNTSHIQFSFLF